MRRRFGRFAGRFSARGLRRYAGRYRYRCPREHSGHPDKRFALWQAIRGGQITVVTSDAAIAELKEVALRLIVRSALPLLESNFLSFLAEYLSLARVIPSPPERFVLEVDPKDSLFFNIAIEARADVLTTFNVRHILPVRESGNPQYQALRLLAPNLRLLHPKELAQELIGKPWAR